MSLKKSKYKLVKQITHLLHNNNCLEVLNDCRLRFAPVGKGIPYTLTKKLLNVAKHKAHPLVAEKVIGSNRSPTPRSVNTLKK